MSVPRWALLQMGRVRRCAGWLVGASDRSFSRVFGRSVARPVAHEGPVRWVWGVRTGEMVES